jgi:hypothetical protein
MERNELDPMRTRKRIDIVNDLSEADKGESL